MKILFIQLPLISHGHDYIQGNIEYAPGAITSFIKKNHPSVKTEVLPAYLSSFASDSVILRYIKTIQPDMIAFTCYLWNIERHLSLAKEIFSNHPGIEIICGGPEISAGSMALREYRSSVKYFIVGEGEWFFSRLLQGEDISQYSSTILGNCVINQSQEDLVPADDISEPFTSRELNLMPDGSIYLELTRGCPYRCSYCYYSKMCYRVRELPFQLLLSALSSGRAIEEIYLLSPTFDASPDFIERLHHLKNLNHGVSLHTELRPGNITREKAELLYEAGFRSLEVGLQTLTRESLKAVQRSSDPDKDLQGIINLRDAGIELKIGIIPGLPGESLESFMNTVDTLLSLDLGDFTELYPLMILPGTAIREQADRDGITYQQDPPYYYLDGWGMNLEEIQSVSRYTEDSTGLSQSCFTLPDFGIEMDSGLTSACYIRGEEIKESALIRLPEVVETSLFSFHFLTEKSRVLKEVITDVVEKLPPGHLFNFIFYTNSPVDEKSILKAVETFDDNSFHRRLSIYISMEEGLSVRLFHVTRSLTDYIRLDNLYTLIEPLLQVDNHNLEELEEYIAAENELPPLLIKNSLYATARDILCDYYGEEMERVAFEKEEEQMAWYHDMSIEYLELPYRFKSISI